MAAQTNKCVHEHTTQLGYCYDLICFLPRNSCLLIPEIVVELVFEFVEAIAFLQVKRQLDFLWISARP